MFSIVLKSVMTVRNCKRSVSQSQNDKGEDSFPPIVRQNKEKRFYVGDGVSVFLTYMATFLDDIKEWSGLFFDAHQLDNMSNFKFDVKLLLSTSKF